MTTRYRYSLSQRSFASLWEHELRQIGSQRPREDYFCNACEMQTACAGCPAFNYLETGEESTRSEYACETTRRRWNTIHRMLGRNGEVARAAPATSTEGFPDGRLPVLSGRRSGCDARSEGLEG